MDSSHTFNSQTPLSLNRNWNYIWDAITRKNSLDKNLSVLSKSLDKRLLPLLIRVYCLAKNELGNEVTQFLASQFHLYYFPFIVGLINIKYTAVFQKYIRFFKKLLSKLII